MNWQNTKNQVSNIIGFIQYNLAIRKNYYSLKFIGEKSNDRDSHNTVILYQMKGRKKTIQICIKDLLENVKLLENFTQKDAVKFGAIAMGDKLFQESKESMQKIFETLKQKMLVAESSPHVSISGKNYFPCGFSGGKVVRHETVVFYTAYGKRTVFEVPIKKLLQDRVLLDKFHPMIAVKFGAIAMGDALFANNQISKKDAIKLNGIFS